MDSSAVHVPWEHQLSGRWGFKGKGNSYFRNRQRDVSCVASLRVPGNGFLSANFTLSRGPLLRCLRRERAGNQRLSGARGTPHPTPTWTVDPGLTWPSGRPPCAGTTVGELDICSPPQKWLPGLGCGSLTPRVCAFLLGPDSPGVPEPPNGLPSSSSTLNESFSWFHRRFSLPV